MRSAHIVRATRAGARGDAHALARARTRTHTHHTHLQREVAEGVAQRQPHADVAAGEPGVEEHERGACLRGGLGDRDDLLN